MKTKLLILVCLLVLAAGSVNTVRADQTAAAAADALVARPLGLVGTAVGSVLFVISLPFTAPSGHIHQSAQELVIKPAKATFDRPMGDFSSLETLED